LLQRNPFFSLTGQDGEIPEQKDKRQTLRHTTGKDSIIPQPSSNIDQKEVYSPPLRNKLVSPLTEETSNLTDPIDLAVLDVDGIDDVLERRKAPTGEDKSESKTYVKGINDVLEEGKAPTGADKSESKTHVQREPKRDNNTRNIEPEHKVTATVGKDGHVKIRIEHEPEPDGNEKPFRDCDDEKQEFISKYSDEYETPGKILRTVIPILVRRGVTVIKEPFHCKGKSEDFWKKHGFEVVSKPGVDFKKFYAIKGVAVSCPPFSITKEVIYNEPRESICAYLIGTDSLSRTYMENSLWQFIILKRSIHFTKEGRRMNTPSRDRYMWAVKGMHLPCNVMYTVDGITFTGNQKFWTADQLQSLRLPKRIRQLGAKKTDQHEDAVDSKAKKKQPKKKKRVRQKNLNKTEKKLLSQALSMDLH
jgi:hypothetical protein